MTNKSFVQIYQVVFIALHFRRYFRV